MKQNITLLLFSLISCILIAEIILRINGKYLSYSEQCIEDGEYVSPYSKDNLGWAHTPQPFSVWKDEKAEFTTFWIANNEGLKDKNISLKKEGLRVFILGDSFTEGVGAPNDSAYPRVLEKLLSANSDTPIEVINCGISGADIFSEYKLLKNKMLKYKPDYVIVTLNSSDFIDYIYRGGFERFLQNNEMQYKKAPWFEPLYAKSHIVRHIVHDGYDLGFDFLNPQEREQMMLFANKMIVQAIDSFQNLCTRNKIKFSMVFHPLKQEFTVNNYPLLNLIKHVTPPKNRTV